MTYKSPLHCCAQSMHALMESILGGDSESQLKFLLRPKSDMSYSKSIVQVKIKGIERNCSVIFTGLLERCDGRNQGEAE